MPKARVVLLCCLSVCGFAANSLLARKALGGGLAGAAPYTALRLLSGALVLGLVLALRGRRGPPGQAGWRSALALFLYAAPFSFAYLRLQAGTGALLLFGTVQVTMICVGLLQGERPPARTWAGLGLAFAGLLVLTLPGAQAPQPGAALLMIAAGVCWGTYSLRGRRAADGISATAEAFLYAAPLAAALWLLAPAQAPMTARGAALAIASGALASGAGYSLWNSVLPSLTATAAAVLQLSVPAIAAAGGVLLLGEPLSPRVAAGGAAILGGVALAVLRGRPRATALVK